MRRLWFVTAALLAGSTLVIRPAAQRANVPDDVQVRAIEPPAHPLPAEFESARVRKFSFFAYGDTRSAGAPSANEPPLDGHVLQAAHGAVVDAMLVTARRLASTDFPVRFVVSSGDAVLYGPNGAMWNTSYVPVVDRLTIQGGLPFFFAPGNHDMTARPPGDPEREHGLRNTLAAMARVMPDDSSRRLAGYATYAFGYGN